MFRRVYAVVLVLLLFFSGCGKKEAYNDRALRFRTELMNENKCHFKADITADFGDRVYDFSVDAKIRNNAAELKVLAPEEIAGITATISDDRACLEYDGVVLEFGKMAGGKVAAMEAAWILYQCWVGQYIAYSGSDGDLVRVTYLKGYDDAQLTVDTWFNTDGTPVYAEIFYDDVRCLRIEIETFEF